jgi:predicted cobalt transporter CbtA
VSYNDVVWLPNALIMTALLAAVALWRWRSRGPLIGLRWVGVALLPLALYAVGLFRLLWTVGLAVSRFVTGFVFRPSVWLGVILAVIALVLIVLPSKIGGRRPAVEDRKAPQSLSRSKKRSAGSDDDDMSEIQDILKKHGLG